MQKYTVDQLIADTIAIDNTPISQQTFSNDQIAKFLDEEMRNTVIPLFTKAREEYFVHTWAFPVDQSTTSFTIPPQTAGFRLRDIYLYDASDNFLSTLIRINPDQIPTQVGFGGFNSFNTFTAPTYYVENNVIKFYPRLPVSGVLKVRYFKAPNHLGLYADCGGQVTGKLPGNVLQLDNVPSTWTTFSGSNAITVDATQTDSPYNFVQYSNGTLS